METSELTNDEQTKISRFYDSAKMHRYVRLYEFYAELSRSGSIDEKKRNSIVKSMEHYRRMILNMAVKEIPSDFRSVDVASISELISFVGVEAFNR